MTSFNAISTAGVKAALFWLTRWEVTGQENVPRNGSLIVVANHLSLIDPPLLSASIPRRISFMAKEELFNAWSAPFIRWFGAFPVRRGVLDRKAIRQAMQVIEKGESLGIFPEGKRSPNQQMIEGELGVAMIAHHSGASILPIGISGSENIRWPDIIWKRPKVIVAIGRPFSLPKKEGKRTREHLIESKNQIMRHIAEILPPRYQGIWEYHIGDHTDL